MTIKQSVALALLLLMGLVACDPGHGVTWTNHTDQKVTIYDGEQTDRQLVSLDPGQETRLADTEYVGSITYVVRDQEMKVLAEVPLTWDQLKQMNYRFDVTQQLLDTY